LGSKDLPCKSLNNILTWYNKYKKMDIERLAKERVEQIGVFDFAGLYRYMHWWLKVKEYYGVTEQRYSERFNAKGDKDVDIIWKATKTSDYIGETSN